MTILTSVCVKNLEQLLGLNKPGYADLTAKKCQVNRARADVPCSGSPKPGMSPLPYHNTRRRAIVVFDTGPRGINLDLNGIDLAQTGGSVLQFGNGHNSNGQQGED
jgi:hypothetical protein